MGAHFSGALQAGMLCLKTDPKGVRCPGCLCYAAQEPAAHLKLVAERLGLPLRQFVALMGVHTVARWWRDVQPPYMEQFYSNPPHRFDNTYFR